MKNTLLQKIQTKRAVIGIVGLGYVGLLLMLRFSTVGFKVLGFDIDPGKVALLNNGASHIQHLKASSIAAARTNGFEETSDFSRALEADVLILCVPTPLNKFRKPDLSFMIDTVEELLPHLHTCQLVSLESPTYPGTTDEELLSRIESRGFHVGHDIFLFFSPEREDPGNPDFSTRTIPKVYGGATPACLEVGVALYHAVIDQVVPVSSMRTEEMTKLLENIHHAVNIGLVNDDKLLPTR